jgi:hypothetical protein
MFFYTAYGQKTLSNEFYSFVPPKGTEVSLFNYSHEETANIDGYKFSMGDKLKYIFYLLSNKLNVEINEVNQSNYNDFLGDLGDVEVTSYDFNQKLTKLTFNYKDNVKVVGVLFISFNGNILNRFVFVLPNHNNPYQKFNDEIQNVITSIKILNDKWPS